MCLRHDSDPEAPGAAPLAWPGGYVCHPTGVPELPVLSPTDISQETHGWTCEPLDVQEVLSQGEHFLYYLIKVLRYLEV